MRTFALIAIAAGAAGIAAADVPPPPPEHPLSAECQPFIGLWVRQEMQTTPRYSSTTVLAIDSEHAVVLDYGNQQDVNIGASAQSMALTCKDNADKTVTLSLNGTGETPTEMVVTWLDDTTFTTTENSADPSRGAPTPGFVPEKLTIHWKRVAR